MAPKFQMTRQLRLIEGKFPAQNNPPATTKPDP
jgi:hypothetical protein